MLIKKIHSDKLEKQFSSELFEYCICNQTLAITSAIYQRPEAQCPLDERNRDDIVEQYDLCLKLVEIVVPLFFDIILTWDRHNITTSCSLEDGCIVFEGWEILFQL